MDGFELKESSTGKLTHKNGGRLVIKSCVDNARGFHSDMLIIKDAHLITNFEIFWSCVYPICFRTQKCLINGKSTKGGLFEEILNKGYKLNILEKDFFKKILFN